MCFTRTAVLFKRMRTGGLRLIEFGVVCFCQHDVGRRTARHGVGNQLAHQQTRNRCVAVRKMEEVLFGFFVRDRIPIHSLARRRIQLHSVEARQIESPRVLRRDGIDSDSKQSVRESLVELDDVFMNAGDVSQIAGITDASQLCLFLIRTEAGEIILRLLSKGAADRAWPDPRSARPQEIAFNNAGVPDSGVLALASAARAGIDDQLVDTESLFVEENLRAQAERAIEILADILRIGRNIDAQFFNDSLGNGAVGRGTLDGKRASKAEAESIA